MSRSKRKRAWRKLQAGRTPREVNGAWHLFLPSKGGTLADMFPAIIGEPLATDTTVIFHDENGGAS